MNPKRLIERSVLIQIFLLTLANFVSGKVALLLAIPPGYATALWPPAGISLAALLLYGNRLWPGIWLGSFLLNVSTGFDASSLMSLLKSLALPSTIAFGSVLQALLAGFAVKRFCGYPDAFERGEKVTRFLICTGPLSCLAASTFGVLSLFLSGVLVSDKLAISWATWWVGDTIGVAVFTPLILVKLAPPRVSQRAKSLLEQKAAPLAVFLCFMVLTFWYRGISTRDTQVQGGAQFEASANETAVAVNRRMKVYRQMLLAGKGLFAASQSVDRKEWEEFVTNFNIHENYPGIQGLGFSAYIKPEKKAEVVRRVRAEGYPDFVIEPEGTRPEYSSIIYLEPMDERNRRAFGYDMLTEPTRRAAMESARDQDQAVLSGRVVLRQEMDQNRQNGVLLYLPIYENGKPHGTLEERRRNLIGWVYAPFRVNDLMRAILSGTSKGAHLDIFDGKSTDDETLLFNSDLAFGASAAARPSLYESIRRVEIGGRPWTLRFRSTREFEEALDYRRSTLVLLGGTAVSTLIFFLTFTLFSTRVRAQGMADTITRELREVRERFELAVQGSNDGIWDWNIETGEVYYSPQWKKMLGYEEGELDNKIKTWTALIHPEDRGSAVRAIQKYLRPAEDKSGKFCRLSTQFELMARLRHKDGEYRWILARGIALRGEDGKAYRMAGSHTDMTIRKYAEQQLRLAHVSIQEKEALLRNVIRHMPVALFMKDARKDYRFMLWNDEAERIFGLKRERVLGKNDYDFFPKEQADFFHSMDEKVMNGKEMVDIPEEPVDSAGQGRIILHTIKVPLFDSAGAPLYLLGISENITERKRLEQMKNEFISTVSHELKTPLTSIRGSLGIVIGGVAGSISGQAKDMLEIAYRNCERLVRLINDILDIEKIESGKISYRLELHPLDALIRHGVAANLPYAQALGVKLAVTEIAADAKVSVDEDRFAQVMANLISNACKFSERDGLVEISAVRREGNLRVTVKDHGPGIPDDFRARIFQKFSQADSSDGRQKGGTGLGLSIAKSLVEGFGGRIGFESEKGRGTAFYFDLPESGLDLKPAIGPSSGKQRLLICEDSPDIARVMSEILSASGYEVDIVYTAAQAKEALQGTHYDLMTLDVLLPGQDGLSFLKDIRGSEKLRDLPVVVVSVSADGEKKRMSASELNVFDWMAKPVNVESLAQCVSRAIGASKREGRPSVLVVEDSEDMQAFIISALESIAQVTVAGSRGEALEFLKSGAFDLVVLDNILPDGSGIDMLSDIVRTPVVLLSAETVPDQIRKSLFAVLNRRNTERQELLDAVRSALQSARGR